MASSPEDLLNGIVRARIGLLLCLIGAAMPVYAQPAIAGLVKDSSGAVLPGVAVEAASPALIEKIRTAETDGSGQYRIEDLRPGTYTVTFTRAGSASFQEKGVELTGSLTVTVNAKLEVGALSDTVTVTAETLFVDTHSSKREMALGADIIRAIPTVRSYNALLIVVPGIVTSASSPSHVLQIQPLLENFCTHPARSPDE